MEILSEVINGLSRLPLNDLLILIPLFLLGLTIKGVIQSLKK